MVVLRNMDELMDLELDDPALNGDGALVFAATHACACNPLKKAHYPTEWVPENCALTTQHAEPDRAQREGAPASSGVGMLNSGLLVINPSRGIFDKIQAALNEPALVQKYHFPDQGLLSDIFAGRWYPLPYIYNGLRTLRWEGVHSAIWRDEEVKVVHYIFDNKPWLDQRPENGETKEANSLGNGIGNGTSTEPSWKESDAVIHNWWWDIDEDRRRSEHEKGIVNGINGY
ncbi:hypothetical protein VTN49DRAFT_3073 [Thermomyces lanuginosus]|uniref:uncharacterized protein n=1 Tax=Thermomyces lanuginosus TaxID=5541 RepID=UPI0037425609